MGFICPLTILLLACAAQANLYNEIGPIAFSVRTVLKQPAWTCDSSNSNFQCRDCNNIQKCDGHGNTEYTVNCKDQFGVNTPFCDIETNKCVANGDSCQEYESGFKCPNGGYYPDLTDCKKYIACSAKDEQGVAFKCLYSSVYSHSRKRCITGAPCLTVTAECANKNKVIAYAPDKSLYVICNGGGEPQLKDCGNTAFTFNVTSMQCEFQCVEEGVFPHPSIDKNYYICARNGKDIVKQEKVCRDGTIFDAQTRNCIKKESNNTPATTAAPTAVTTAAPTVAPTAAVVTTAR